MPTSSASTNGSVRSAPGGGVQSLERAFDLLERMADAGGEVGLSELSTSSGLPLPTIHRLMRTLVACGYVRQQPNRRYALGPRLIRLGESSSRLLGTWARPYLARLVEETGETANMALLDGDEIVYVAQVPSKHSMRMFTEVGRRVLPHSTGVGKALLAGFPPQDVRALLARTGMPAATDRTITTPEGFLAALDEVRRQGYAMDDNEQEIGVRCLAVSGARRPHPGRPLDLRSRGAGHGGGDGADRAGAPAGGDGTLRSAHHPGRRPDGLTRPDGPPRPTRPGHSSRPQRPRTPPFRGAREQVCVKPWVTVRTDPPRPALRPAPGPVRSPSRSRRRSATGNGVTGESRDCRRPRGRPVRRVRPPR
ncbi:hypothetical protein SHIRM173S_00407 [Streptomyces hirsutus]